MQYYKKILPLFLIFIASSAFGGTTTSRVTNKTKDVITVYWTAAGCIRCLYGVTEVCKYQHLSPNATGVYKFKGSKTNIQIKINPLCKRNGNKKGNIYNFYCPSGSWGINGGEASKRTCKLYGKGRGHVRNVIVDNFSSYQTEATTCGFDPF